jgi:phosphoglycerol transferase MdoB-like AlkP superfamily enzyme
MQRIKTVLKLFGVLLLSYLLLRIIFGITYYRNESLSSGEYFAVFFWGFRMDFAALFYINIAFLLYYFFVDRFIRQPWGWRFALLLFSVVNIFFLAINVIDLAYFRYTLRRSTVDIFFILEDSLHSFGAVFSQYWFILLLFVLGCVLLVKITRRILKSEIKVREPWYIVWLTPILFMAVGWGVARGFQSRPIVPSTALLHGNPSVQPWINNSTLNLLYSSIRFSAKPDRKHYFTNAELDSVFTIRRQYPNGKFEKRNVVLFVLESFDQGFFNPGPRKAYTPFFDSLMRHSVVCENAFANGHESVKGIMAILGSVPPFLDEPIFISNYSSVPFDGIGSLLKREGYNTHFFMGAEYDHFNFAKLCKMVGIDQYHSRDDYNHPDRDDGAWGIYDHYFFQYFADKLAREQQPFFSVLFNLSSHPPFRIPAPLAAGLKVEGQSAQHNSITYVDYSFRKLFDAIRQEPWFSQTIFLFCADHTLLQDVYDRSRQYRGFHIPFFIYDPRHPEGTRIHKTVQQLDLVPTILHKLGYTKPFMSFGNSIYLNDTLEKGFSIYKANEGYQYTSDGMLTGFEDKTNRLLYHYNYLQDSLLMNDRSRSGDSALTLRTRRIKAIIQRFNNSLLDHRLLIEK